MSEQAKSDNQRIWDYIGRNRLFFPSDICMITDIDLASVESFCLSFEKAGYLIREGTQYRCIQYNGKIVPIISDNGEVRDDNLSVPKKKRTKPPPNIAVLKVILDFPTEPFSRLEISAACTLHYKTVYDALDVMVENGIITSAASKRGKSYKYRVPPAIRSFYKFCDGSFMFLDKEIR